jgi:Protein of unknown function (DUF1360)
MEIGNSSVIPGLQATAEAIKPGTRPMQWYLFVIGSLAVWRITHLLNVEDGPVNVLARLRRAAGRSSLGELLDCFYCLSLWVALPIALLVGGGWEQTVLLWLALSGASILLERSTAGPAQAVYYEDNSPPKE